MRLCMSASVLVCVCVCVYAPYLFELSAAPLRRAARCEADAAAQTMQAFDRFPRVRGLYNCMHQSCLVSCCI